jgi:hypothetical protein
MTKLKMPANCVEITEPGFVCAFIGAETWRQREIRTRAAHHEAGHCVAALQFSVPIKACTIKDGYAGMFRGNYRPPAVGVGVEVMSVLALSGPAAEREYVGPITDGSDATDIAMAREYLSQRYDASQILFQLNRARDSAAALVRTPWARQRITAIATALLQHGTLSGQDIAGLV